MNLNKKDLIKLSISIFGVIILIIMIVFILISNSIDNDSTLDGENIQVELIPSSDRNEKEEKNAVQKNIESINSKSSDVDYNNFTMEEQEEFGELPQESFDMYLKEFRKLSRTGSWSEMSNLAYTIRSQYSFDKEQLEIIYSFLGAESMGSEFFETVSVGWTSLKDVESKIYSFINLTIPQQGGLIKSQDIQLLPRPSDGVIIKEIISENVSWIDSLAWKYFSDESLTHIYKIVVDFGNNGVYNVYYVENDILGSFITNIENQNKQADISTYKDYFELTGTEADKYEFDGSTNVY